MVYKHRTISKLFICLLMTVWILRIAAVAGSAESVRYLRNTQYFPDAAGGFYMVTYDSDYYTLYTVRSDGSVHEELRESTQIEAVAADNGWLTMAAAIGVGKGIIRYCADGSMKNVMMVQWSDGAVASVCADSRNHIWMADADHALVREYDSGGQELKCYRTGTAVTALLTDAAGSHVYAAEENGTLRELNGNRVWTDIPCENGFEQNGNYLCCHGVVYTLDTEAGLTEIFSSDYPLICRTNRWVYASDGHIVYRLSEDGSVDAVCDTGTAIQRLTASGDTAAYVSAEGITVITPSMMKRQEQSSHPMLSAVMEPDVPPDLSALEMVDETTVEVIQGTTVAALKKQMHYPGWSLTVRNHQGSMVSSGTIGTGWELFFSKNGQEQCYATLVMGDLTGEGNVNARDSTMLADYLVEGTELEQPYLTAADMNRNGCIDFNDFVMLYGG